MACPGRSRKNTNATRIAQEAIERQMNRIFYMRVGHWVDMMRSDGTGYQIDEVEGGR